MNRYLLPFLLFIVGSIFTLGLVMIFSTSSAEVLDHVLDISTKQALFRQIAYAVVGGGIAFGIYRLGYRQIIQASPLLLALFAFFLLLVLIPGIGKQVNGSKRWLGIAGVSFQPSEFVKYFAPTYFIYRVVKQKAESISFSNFFKILVPLGVPLFLILLEPNNGTVAVIAVSLVMLFFLSKVPLKFWAMPLFAFALIGGVFASQLPYVKGRIQVYLHPELDLQGRGHQPHQAKIAAGSGGLLGKGPGNSWQKLSYLPEAQNDYIGAIFAEEFGFVGVVVLIFLYMCFASLGFLVAFDAIDLQGFYLASAITFLISLQAFLNLGVVSGLLPSTGLNLPFFSQGGSSLIANLIGIGLLASISKQNGGSLRDI